MRNRYIQHFEDTQIKGKEIPQFKAGDTLKIGIRISEGDKTRIQNFEGVCISLRGVGTGKTFTVSNVIAAVNKPTLVLAHNKTLAGQLYSELKEFFPENRVEYFISNFDFFFLMS